MRCQPQRKSAVTQTLSFLKNLPPKDKINYKQNNGKTGVRTSMVQKQ